MRRLLVRSTALLALAFSLTAGVSGTSLAATQPIGVDHNDDVVTATYEGQPIDPMQASHHFCHTRDYPIVRCFANQAEVDKDLGLVEPTAPSLTSVETGVSPDWAGGAYTIAYWDSNYGGNALTVYGALWNLDLIGWNDAISSIKSVNCGIPRYYVDANYSGAYWQNGCNYWSSSLGIYNDKFSSVVNEAP
jgi:hypothetical protein